MPGYINTPKDTSPFYTLTISTPKSGTTYPRSYTHDTINSRKPEEIFRKLATLRLRNELDRAYLYRQEWQPAYWSQNGTRGKWHKKQVLVKDFIDGYRND